MRHPDFSIYYDNMKFHSATRHAKILRVKKKIFEGQID